MFRFKSVQAAYRWADNAVKAEMVIMGDDNRFWVVTMATAEKLIRAGFEIAPRPRY